MAGTEDIGEGITGGPPPPYDHLAIEKLLREYEQCIQSYNSRDYIAEDEFSKLIQSFAFFLAILLGINFLASVNSIFKYAIGSVLGLMGLVSFVSYLLDLQGTCSAKVAVRKRAREIEELLPGFAAPRIWQTIDERRLFYEERVLKRIKINPIAVVTKQGIWERERETEGSLFVWSARLIVVLWLVVAIAIVATGAGH
jgi:hypothetical protein